MFGKAILKVIINQIIKFVLIYTNVHKMKKLSMSFIISYITYVIKFIT